MLGDVVQVPVPEGTARLKVVMLGDSGEHLCIEESFLKWVKHDRGLDRDELVLEWIDKNPFKHRDPRYAPVGAYMFSGLDDFLEFMARGAL